MNWLSLLGLEGLAARWRANLIEGAIAAEDRMDLARLEWADLKQRLQQLLVLTILVAGLTVVALIMVSLAVLVHFGIRHSARWWHGWWLACGLLAGRLPRSRWCLWPNVRAVVSR